MAKPLDNVELYAYTTVWHLQTGDNINIASNSGVICSDSEDAALGHAVRLGKESYPRHSLNHHIVYAVRREIIEKIYKRQALGELLPEEIEEAETTEFTPVITPE